MNSENKRKTKKELDKVSHYICFLLRHKPEAASLDMSTDGWVSVSQLLKSLSSSPKTQIEMDDLIGIVSEDSEQRYSFKDNFNFIRCEQGHSLEWVKIEYDKYLPSNDLYHGTSPESVESILKFGLVSKSRNHLHLSTSATKAYRVGRRHSKKHEPVILKISPDTPSELFISKNGVVLTSFVPPEFISILNA